MEWMQHMLTRRESDEEDSLTIFTCWLPVDKRVKEGSIISLKDNGSSESKLKWKVEKQFKQLRTKFPPRQDWNVGGLY